MKYSIEKIYAATQLCVLMYTSDTELLTMSPDYLKEKVTRLFGEKAYEELSNAEITTASGKLIYEHVKSMWDEDCGALGNMGDLITTDTFRVNSMYWQWQGNSAKFNVADTIDLLATKMPSILTDECIPGTISLHPMLQSQVDEYFKKYEKEIKIIGL